LYDHNQTIKGVAFSKDGYKFLSSSADKSINLYDFKNMFEAQGSEEHVYGDFRLHKSKKKVQPLTKYLSKLIIGNVDHSPQ
jgi:WD40 repeat protein